MGLAQRVAGLVGPAGLAGLWSLFDFEAPGLTVRARLTRLEYAASQAARQCCEPAARSELEFALAECRALLEMDSLEGEAAERARVGQRLERVARVVKYHEGRVASLNRRYWWVPFLLGVLATAFCCLQSLSWPAL